MRWDHCLLYESMDAKLNTVHLNRSTLEMSVHMFLIALLSTKSAHTFLWCTVFQMISVFICTFVCTVSDAHGPQSILSFVFFSSHKLQNAVGCNLLYTVALFTPSTYCPSWLIRSQGNSHHHLHLLFWMPRQWPPVIIFAGGTIFLTFIMSIFGHISLLAEISCESDLVPVRAISQISIKWSANETCKHRRKFVQQWSSQLSKSVFAVWDVSRWSHPRNMLMQSVNMIIVIGLTKVYPILFLKVCVLSDVDSGKR